MSVAKRLRDLGLNLLVMVLSLVNNTFSLAEGETAAAGRLRPIPAQTSVFQQGLAGAASAPLPRCSRPAPLASQVYALATWVTRAVGERAIG